MGYYIETGTTRDKASILCEKAGATIIDEPKSFSDIPADKALICVVDNRIFEAAGYCYSADEFRVFSDPTDPRPKTWLLMDLEKTQQLSHFVGSYDYKKMQEGK